jgi:hypothetical protein
MRSTVRILISVFAGVTAVLLPFAFANEPLGLRWSVWLFSPFILIAGVAYRTSAVGWCAALCLGVTLVGIGGVVTLTDEQSTASLALITLPLVSHLATVVVVVVDFAVRQVLARARFRSRGVAPR